MRASRPAAPLLQAADAVPVSPRRCARAASSVVRAEGQAVNAAAVEEKSAAATLKRERRQGRLSIGSQIAIACAPCSLPRMAAVPCLC